MDSIVNQEYCNVSHHPNGSDRLDSVGSVLHSVCVTKGIGWREAYCKLADCSGELGYMPQDRRTIRSMLGKYGFYCQAGSFANRTVSELIDECSSLFSDDEKIILHLGKGIYVPLVPVKKDETIQYVLHYPVNQLLRMADEVWIAWKDGNDHSIRPRRKTTVRHKEVVKRVVESDSVYVYNENPNDNLIGDCAVRAVAGVLEISWAEAVHRLAAAQDYSATTINLTTNIVALLRKEGFQEFAPPRHNGRSVTGSEFCDMIHDMFQPGTRIFAEVGSDHAVAVLVFDGDYRIVDTWDCSARKINRYWAKYPKRQIRSRKQTEVSSSITELHTGMKIKHTLYGTGEIVQLSDTTATIRFSENVTKKMSAVWMKENCRPVE